jgi:hypothetical protein
VLANNLGYPRGVDDQTSKSDFVRFDSIIAGKRSIINMISLYHLLSLALVAFVLQYVVGILSIRQRQKGAKVPPGPKGIHQVNPTPGTEHFVSKIG